MSRLLPHAREQDALRAGLGALDLLHPGRMAALELGGPPRTRDLVVYRILGVRQLVQSAVAARSGLRALGAGVDLLHAATMLPVALGSRRWRRAALVQSAIALTLALAGLASED